MGEVSNRSPNGSVGEQQRDVDTKKSKKTFKPLPSRQFEVRDSLLVVICQDPHIKVVKNIFAASLVGLFLSTVVHDWLERGEFKIGYKVITAGFGGFHWVILIWLMINLGVILAYFCFNIWANIRINFPPKAQNKRVWDTVWLVALIAYYILQFRVSSVMVWKLELAIVSSAIVCLEQTRLLMKVHAFVRSNAEKVLNYKSHSEKKLQLPSFRHYIFFLFAPTIVYADQYPRTKIIRWNLVLEKVVELVGVVFYYAFLLERFIIPTHQDIGLRQFTLSEVIVLIFDNFAVGLMFLLLGFYVVLDTTQNLVGELMKFGDRQFYLAWWTATNYSMYFKTWNLVVGDWLYTYIYKDLYEYVIPGNKTAAKLTVFIISAIVHEWALTYMFGFLFPALFIAFSFVAMFLSSFRLPKLNIVNVIFWYLLAFGSGVLVCLYTLEWFVRRNMPVESTSLKDFIVPRLFTCGCVSI
ncbi:sterol O-acyltransferase 1 [Anthonomus grandis grandis]|uniref:sterol O-acyltransferase 1 n=1 Tax=Anthonomus grandis grandis TaxID=2921223 RepID=UPI0021668AF1|nr:sterol O-acyltransferase 1 [Anthonomus grandis grandis]